MRTTGRYYSDTKKDYDVDHEITNRVTAINSLVNTIDSNDSVENEISIVEAMLETLEDRLKALKK